MNNSYLKSGGAHGSQSRSTKKLSAKKFKKLCESCRDYECCAYCSNKVTVNPRMLFISYKYTLNSAERSVTCGVMICNDCYRLRADKVKANMRVDV